MSGHAATDALKLAMQTSDAEVLQLYGFFSCSITKDHSPSISIFTTLIIVCADAGENIRPRDRTNTGSNTCLGCGAYG